MNEYISKLAKIKLPYRDTFLRNNETIEFFNKSAKVHFYNKYKQLKKERIKDNELMEQAKNILRFEIQLKKDGIRQYDKNRKAVDLLTTEFYEQVMDEYLEIINTKLEKVTDDLELSPEIFNVGLTIAKIERVFSFMAFLDEFGEPFLKNIYDKSYYNRQKDVTEYFQKLKMKQNNKLSL